MCRPRGRHNFFSFWCQKLLGGGAFDMGRGSVIYDYEPGGPVPDFRVLIGAGLIGSSFADANPGYAIGYAESSALFSEFPATFAGRQVDDTAVLMTVTRLGDANLDRRVNLADFNRLAGNFGATGAVWSQGDFNYDGMVNLTDFDRLAGNFGHTAMPSSGRGGDAPTRMADLILDDEPIGLTM